jgi:hypothetical protein
MLMRHKFLLMLSNRRRLSLKSAGDSLTTAQCEGAVGCFCAIPAVDMIGGCPFVLRRGYFKVVVARRCARQTCAKLGDLCRALELDFELEPNLSSIREIDFASIEHSSWLERGCSQPNLLTWFFSTSKRANFEVFLTKDGE